MQPNDIRKAGRGLFATVVAVWLAGAAAAALAQDRSLVFTGPTEPVVAGARTAITLNVLNVSAGPIPWAFPQKIACRILPARGAALLESLDLLPGPETGAIPAGAFARQEYGILFPEEAVGRVVVEFPDLTENRLVLEVQAEAAPAGAGEKSGLARVLQQAEPKEAGREFDPGRFFKEHISGYEPLYFIAGTESPNAKFQISFKYQLLNHEGALARKAPVLEGLHLAYTQTSLWDWNKPSAPFLDSSYKPEFLYRIERLAGGQRDDWFQVDLQGGLQHESNGRDGAASRSLNIAYLRPRLALGKEDGIRLSLEPRAWVYVGGLDDNPDLARYRGYVDLRAVVGWRRGLQLSALGRLGDRGDRGSLQLDLTYPMMSLFSGSFSLYLHAQYFTGYGESLLLYNERSSIFRAGFSLYR